MYRVPHAKSAIYIENVFVWREKKRNQKKIEKLKEKRKLT